MLPGHYLIHQDDPPEECSLSSRARSPRGSSQKTARRCGSKPCAAGGWWASWAFCWAAARTASVVADEPSRVYRITRAMLAACWSRRIRMRRQVFHRIIARLLSERVVHLIDTVDALQR